MGVGRLSPGPVQEERLGGIPAPSRRFVLFVAAAVVFCIWASDSILLAVQLGGVARPTPVQSLQRDQARMARPAPPNHADFASPDDAPDTVHSSTPPPASFNTCPVHQESSALHYAHTGERCIFPFFHGGRWHITPAAGVCAVAVQPSGAPERLETCDTQSAATADLQCVSVHNASTCGGEPIPGAGCGTRIERATCVCRGRGGTVRRLVECKQRTCAEECRYVLEDVMSAGHAAANDSTAPDLVVSIAALALKSSPTRKGDLQRWEEFIAGLPTHASTKQVWCGRGIVIMAGSIGTLPQAVATVSYLRDHLRSDLPVEIWRAASENEELPQGLVFGLQQLGAVVRTLPAEARSRRATDMYSLKPAAVLASSFDEVLFLDADALPLVDPITIFDERAKSADTSAVFWPDFWTLFHDAKIWDAIGGWPFPTQIAPSQESGIMVVCKSCGAWRPLALAFYFSYHSTVYYRAIYVGHYGEKMCGNVECTRKGVNQHVMPGMGDKDTFQIAHMALNVSFTMMRPPAIVGPLLNHSLVCGASIAQRGSGGELVVLHHNSNKWGWVDYWRGRWKKTGLLLSHVMYLTNESSAWHADGQNMWDSITYNWRDDAGKQATPDGARWCVIYKGETRVETATAALGYDLEETMLDHHKAVYATPWLSEWVGSKVPSPPADRKKPHGFTFTAAVLIMLSSLAGVALFARARSQVIS